MSSSNYRDATKFGMDSPRDKADQMRESGKQSQEKRNKGGDESIKLPNDAEEELMDKSARESQDRRAK